MTAADYAELVQKDRDHFIHPQYLLSEHQQPIIFERGKGVWLEDINGKRYIDGLSSLWNVAVGHGRTELAQAAAEQMEKLAFCNSYVGFSNVPAIELADRLINLVYPNMRAVYYVNSGSEANDGAYKAARFYWKLRGKPNKVKIISRREAYHGSTLFATSVTGMPVFWKNFEPMMPEALQAPSPYRYRCQFCSQEAACTTGCVSAIEEIIAREGADTIAAVIAEPVQGAGGVIPAPPEYFPALRRLCDRYEVLLISDEVITGFGRTGKWFALDHWDVKPDIMTFAKAVTSAYVPLAGFIISDQIYETITSAPPDARFMHANTNSGHPTACAVALRNLRILEEEGLIENAARMGARLREGLESLRDLDGVGDIRGLGLMQAVELVEDKETRKPFDPSLNVGPRLAREARDRGLISRVKGDSFLMAPPLVITEHEIDQIVGILREAIPATMSAVRAAATRA
jgi:adenosylmethionine-8-amino-7-oxononanoate aminotransferase